MLFWYLLISRSATVPGLYRCLRIGPSVGADLRLLGWASIFPLALRGAFPFDDLKAVCLVRAICFKRRSRRVDLSNSA